MVILLAIALFAFCFLGFMLFINFCDWVMKRQDVTS